jgi:hypothetical protein
VAASRALYALALAVAALALTASSASAAKSLDRFLGVPSAEGTTLGGQFGGPRDVAVNETGAGAAEPGDVYVVDNGRHRIQVLSAEGFFKFAIGRNVIADGMVGDQGDVFEKCASATSCQPGVTGTSTDAPEGELASPQGIAIDQATGDFYVRDRDNLRVQQFDAAGGFVRAWGFGVATGASAFEVCTANCQKGLSGTGAGQFGAINVSGGGVAVAPAGSPSAGNVFVVDPGTNIANRRVHEFDPDAATPAAVFVRSFGSGGTGVGQFNTNMPQHVAVDAAGVVYASDTSGNGRINRYTPTATAMSPIGVPPLLSGGTNSTSTSGLEIDPDSDGVGADIDRLYVARDPSSGNTVVQQFDNPGQATPPSAVTDTHAPTLFGTFSPTGLGIDSAAGKLYVTLTSGSSGQGVYVLDDDGTGSAIQAANASATDIGSTTATLSGAVDPADGLVRYSFEYSHDGVAFSATPPLLASGSSSQTVTAPVAGLRPNSTYRVRLVVRKVTAPNTTLTATSTEATFVTDAIAPTASTRAATAIRATSATLQGSVNPNGSATAYYFEYGTTTGYGRRAPAVPASAGAGGEEVLLAQPVDGLEPGATYHFRLVAESAVGRVNGLDTSFAARATPEVSDGRAYELVSPADKVGGQGVGTWYSDPGSSGTSGYASYDGERFAVGTGQGGVLSESGFALGIDTVFSERTPSGWVSTPGFVRHGYGNHFVVVALPGWATPDLRVTLWQAGVGPVRIFPELADWSDDIGRPLLLRDEGGRWEAFGPTDPTDPAQALDPGTFNNAQSTAVAVSDDGRHVVATTNRLRGMGGAGDPTSRMFPDLAAKGGTTYVDDLPTALSDDFPGQGIRSLVHVCTAGTIIPARVEVDGGSKLAPQACPPPLPGRSARLIDPRGGSIGHQLVTTENMISVDGSRVFFMTPDPQYVEPGPCTGDGFATLCPAQVYVRQRQVDGSVATRWISKPEVSGQDAGLLGPAYFEAASDDGDKVVFSTNSPLTPDDPNGGTPQPGGVTTGTASGSSWDLYLYDFPNDPAADPGDGQLTRISAGPTGTGECNTHSDRAQYAAPAAGVRFFARDGSRAYFSCRVPLTGVSSSANGTTTGPGSGSLYAYTPAEPVGERWAFVATPDQECATRGSVRAQVLGVQTAPGSPITLDDNVNCVTGTDDGAFITFFTTAALTADDAPDGSGDIYGYDAELDRLDRLSASQGGAGGAYLCADQPVVSCNADPGIGIQINTGVGLPALGLAADPRDGRERTAFFQSKSRLVPQDKDDVHDVYQWRDGELSLISTGDSATEGAFYRGNDRSGANVYFATFDRLSWQDHDAVLDVYTARVGGGIPKPGEPALCAALADGCQIPTGDRGVSGASSTDTPSTDGNAMSGDRRAVTVFSLSARARRRAARTGNLVISVRANEAGTVSAVAKGRIVRRTRRLARASVEAGVAGPVKLKLRLNRAARQRLSRGDALRVVIRVTSPGARARTRSVRLPGASS